MRAWAIMSGEESMPSTNAPRLAMSFVNWPVPQPTSSTRSPGSGCSRSTRPAPYCQTNWNPASYWPASQSARFSGMIKHHVNHHPRNTHVKPDGQGPPGDGSVADVIANQPAAECENRQNGDHSGEHCVGSQNAEIQSSHA